MSLTTARPAPPPSDGPAARPRPLRSVLGWSGALLALLLAVAASLFLGARLLSPADVLSALVAGEGDRSASTLVVASLRVPRTVLGLLVGAGLAVAGAVMQGVTRNPIASPSVLGVNAGASFAVVVAIDVLGVSSSIGYAAFALAGAAIAAVTAYSLATAGGPAGPTRLALAGAVIATMLAAWTTTVLLLSGQTLEEARHWLAGSLVSRSTDVIWVVTPLVLVGLVLAFALARDLDALALGDEQAGALGVRPGRARLVGGLAVVLMAGGAVAAAGPIAFVGLVVPHIVRRFTGQDHVRVLPACVLGGPVLLLTADVLGRLLVRPAELEVGVITAVVGAPVLIALARRIGPGGAAR